MSNAQHTVSYFIAFDRCQMRAIPHNAEDTVETPDGYAPLSDYLGHWCDDALNGGTAETMPACFNMSKARLLIYQCGFEPMIVAVSSYLNVELDNEEAIELATNYLSEQNWFDGDERDPDHVI